MQSCSVLSSYITEEMKVLKINKRIKAAAYPHLRSEFIPEGRRHAFGFSVFGVCCCVS